MFKGALFRAYKLCSNELLLKKEIDFQIKNFEDNGYKRTKIYQIAQTYKPKKSDPLMKTGHNLSFFFFELSTFLFDKVLTYINAMFVQAYKQYTNDTLVKMKIEI